MKSLLVSFVLLLSLPVLAANELVNSSGNDVQLGDVVVGQSKDFTFTLSNTGSQKISFYEFFLDFTKGQINFSDNGDFPGGGSCNGPEIPVGGSCTYIIKFKPAQLVTLKSNFKINYFYGSKLQKLTIVFRGTGVNAPPPPKPAQLKVDGASPFDFGSVVVGAPALSTALTVTNVGELDATLLMAASLTEPFSYSGGVYPGVSGTCTDTLPAGQTCSLFIDYQPSVAGAATQDVSLSYLDGVQQQELLHTLKGVGVMPAALLIGNGSGSVFDFGNVKVGQSQVQTFAIVNAGASPATNIMVSGLSEPFRLLKSSCPSDLLPGKSCQLEIVFEPQTVTSYKGRMSLVYNNGAFMDGVVQTFEGTGVKKK